jgi:hypothetical protein
MVGDRGIYTLLVERETWGRQRPIVPPAIIVQVLLSFVESSEARGCCRLGVHGSFGSTYGPALHFLGDMVFEFLCRVAEFGDLEREKAEGEERCEFECRAREEWGQCQVEFHFVGVKSVTLCCKSSHCVSTKLRRKGYV